MNEDNIEYLANWMQMKCEERHKILYGEPLWGTWDKCPHLVRQVHRELAEEILRIDEKFVDRIKS